MLRPTSCALLLVGALLASPFVNADTHDPAVTERLVEGHVVFSVLDADPASPPSAMAMRSAPLPDAGGPAGPDAVASRNPGVLWFNDQYLVEPSASEGNGARTTSYGAAVAVQVRTPDGREACGGAVMAVPAGSPDPRETIGPDELLAYVESYRVTDPLGRTHVVDRYQVPFFDHPLWIANLQGTEAFSPDYGDVDCAGIDAATDVPTTCSFLCVSGRPYDNACAFGVDELELGVPVPAFTDRPCMGYMEPSRNAFCYDGTSALEDSCDADGHISRAPQVVLYFPWEDLVATNGTRVDHCNWDAWLEADGDPYNGVMGGCAPYLEPATNGCEVGTPWRCPNDDDHLEGSSHAFTPRSPPHEIQMPCPGAGANPINHGGIGPDADCGYEHAVADIDLYYINAARPLAPPVRLFQFVDLEGEEAAFFDFYRAYPGVS